LLAPLATVGILRRFLLRTTAGLGARGRRRRGVVSRARWLGWHEIDGRARRRRWPGGRR
jgi:hypothetical protein